MSLIEFWEGSTFDVDIRTIASSAVAVKGKSYSNPCRLLEIYGNTNISKHNGQLKQKNINFTDIEINAAFLPKIPGVTLQFGKGIYHPPFIWSDCHPMAIATSFTYTTNAIFRILSNLVEIKLINENMVDVLLDKACLLLTFLYKSNRHLILKNMNNNLNMFFVSKIIEILVGKNIYNVEYQEVERTNNALNLALGMAKEHAGLTLIQQMIIALGKGIAFVERHAQATALSKDVLAQISETTYKYTDNKLVIDDTWKLIEIIAIANDSERKITMCVILDDTVESIDDLLWIQKLMIIFPFLSINLLVNTAQISINFSVYMLSTVFKNPIFRELAVRLGSQLTVTNTYCPLISLQNNLFDANAKNAINDADLVFIKGLNFFETCQLKDKDVFHAFVVYGPISRTYTGLPELSGVFAYFPAGVAGYEHSSEPSKLITMSSIWNRVNNKSAKTVVKNSY